MADRVSTFGADILRYGAAVSLALGLSVVQVFVIPRRLAVETYGEYRAFLLYVGYLGLLHFGLVDGAFLRWVGRPISLIRDEWPRVFRRVLAWQLPALIVAGIGFAVASERITQIYLVAFATCALCANASSFASVTLQAAGDFRGASRATAIAAIVFTASVVLLPIATLGSILAAYVASYAVAAIVGLERLVRITGERIPPSSPVTDRAEPIAFLPLVANGLPVLGAGIAAGLSQYADRILVSLSVPIASFAFYGFASSVMAFAGGAQQTMSRVALAHAARRNGPARATFLEGFYDLIAAGFGLALAAEPLLESVIARLLPKYAVALPIVRALVIGSLFWVGTQVVVLSTLQTYGFVRRQLVVSATGAALVALGAAAGLAWHAPLWGVAAGASAGTAMAWVIGVAIVRRSTPEAHLRSALRFAFTGGTQAVALIVALTLFDSPLARTLAYVVLAFLPTGAALRRARAHWRTDR